MSDLNVNADLQVRDGPVTRPLEAGSPDGDFGVGTTGAASETSLAAVLAELTQKVEPADLAAWQDAATALLTAIRDTLLGVLGADVTDRAGRLLGHVSVDNLPASQTINGNVALDAATLAALETVSVANQPDVATLSKTVDVEAVRDRLPTALDADGSLKVADVFTAGQVLPDQAGAGAVLTFTFTDPVDLVLVRSVGGLARCDPFGGVPTASLGVRCPDDEPTYLPIRAAAVKVFAPAGSVVTIAGFRG